MNVWDIEAGDIVHALDTCTGLWCCNVAFLPDGKNMAAYVQDDDNELFQLSIWDLADKNSLLHPRQFSVDDSSQLALNPTSPLFAAQAPQAGHIKLGDLTTGQWLPGICARGYSASVENLSFSPDGEWLIAHFKDRVVKIWDTAKFLLPVPVLRPDGWLTGPNDEPLLWIPDHLRSGLEWGDPALLSAFGVGLSSTRLDVSGLRKDDWLKFKAASPEAGRGLMQQLPM